MTTILAITWKQAEFISALQKKLRLPSPALDHYCMERFHAPVAELSARQASELIDTLQSWRDVPADLQRFMGQLDLFEEVQK